MNPAMAAHFDEQMRIARRLEKIKHKLIVMSGKGGVGKTTVAVNLAMALGRTAKVGVVDTDVTGPNVPMMLGLDDAEAGGTAQHIEPPEVNGIKVISMGFFTRDKPVIWRGPLKMKAINQMLGDIEWGDLDYLIIDLPPGTSDEPLSIAQNIPEADGIILVTTPQEVALLDVMKSAGFAQTLGLPILGIIENMSGYECPECGHKADLFKAGGGERAAKELGVTFLGRIPIDPEIVVSGDSGKPFIDANPDSKAAKAFFEAANTLKAEVERDDARP
jgi:Mrp family chromosome partitioning ATPase